MAITNKDIDKLKEVFITKEEFNLKFAQVDKRFEQVDKRFEQIDKRFELIDNKLVDIMSHLDFLFKEFRDFRQELKINLHQYRRHDDLLKNHEKRIRIKLLEAAIN